MPCKNIGTNDKFFRKVAYLDIRKGLNLGLKAEKQLQNEYHTEDWALGSILVIMAMWLIRPKILSLKSFYIYYIMILSSTWRDHSQKEFYIACGYRNNTIFRSCSNNFWRQRLQVCVFHMGRAFFRFFVGKGGGPNFLRGDQPRMKLVWKTVLWAILW